jgi:transcriptional regulator with XRE-family HTH domain
MMMLPSSKREALMVGGLGNKEIFSDNLQRYVQRSGKDQKEIAEYVGVAPSTFNEWMKGRKYPRIDKIEILANYFGIKKSDLIEHREEQKSSPSELRLTEGERNLVELFRQVPPEHRQLVLQMIEAALKNL